MDIGGKFTGHRVRRDEHDGQPRRRRLADRPRLILVRDTPGNWNLTFYVTAGLYFVGASCWLFINSTKPLPQDYGE